VFSGLAETLAVRFDCVTLRAVDKMDQAVQAGARLVKDGGWLALLTTRTDTATLQSAAGEGLEWLEACQLPGSDDRVVMLAKAGS
jgi:16S rRNA (guanine527-N7)-methyltransferase